MIATSWIVACINASFPGPGKLDIARDAKAYLAWVESLPTVGDDELEVTDWQDYDPNRWNLH